MLQPVGHTRKILGNRTQAAALGALLLAAVQAPAYAQLRERQLFDNGWRFHWAM